MLLSSLLPASAIERLRADHDWNVPLAVQKEQLGAMQLREYNN